MPRKYYLIQQRKTWSDAQAYCQTYYTDLAIIKTDDNMAQLQNEAQRQLNTNAWIGMYNDVRSWRWSLGNVPLGSMLKWAVGEPNNFGGNQTCGAITHIGCSDVTCSNMFPFVCFDGNNYLLVIIIYFSILSAINVNLTKA